MADYQDQEKEAFVHDLLAALRRGESPVIVPDDSEIDQQARAHQRSARDQTREAEAQGVNTAEVVAGLLRYVGRLGEQLADAVFLGSFNPALYPDKNREEQYAKANDHLAHTLDAVEPDHLAAVLTGLMSGMVQFLVSKPDLLGETRREAITTLAQIMMDDKAQLTKAPLRRTLGVDESTTQAELADIISHVLDTYEPVLEGEDEIAALVFANIVSQVNRGHKIIMVQAIFEGAVSQYVNEYTAYIASHLYDEADLDDVPKE